ncbi:MAG TPA: hypothetical protein DEB39_04765 [Planctomycetaceae bacterium]|nr:hypothetical protein [Planctomycetaceae bacterium]
MKTSPYALRCALIAAIGGLLFGFDTAVISGTMKDTTSVFQLNEWSLGFTVAFALFGTILGAATAQIPSNRLGRKPTLLMMAILFLLASIGTAWPEFVFGGKAPGVQANWISFLIFRFLGGIAIGAASVVSPLYAAEISPARSRGLFVGFFQFNIVFGILLAFFSNFAIAQMNLGENDWRYMFGVMAVPSAAFFLLLFGTPESPRWLVTRGKMEKAKNVLGRLGTDSGSPEEEVAVIQTSLEAEQTSGVKEKFFCHRYRWPIFLAFCIAAFNQLCGINAVMYYAPTIFTMTGVDEKSALFFPVIIGLTNLIVTMAALSVVDKFGRKTLLFVGSIGYISSMAIVATTFMNYAPQFEIGTAGAEVSAAQSDIDFFRTLPVGETAEEKVYRQGKLQSALVAQLVSLEDTGTASKRLKDNTIPKRTNKEKTARSEELKDVSIEDLATLVATAVKETIAAAEASEIKAEMSPMTPANGKTYDMAELDMLAFRMAPVVPFQGVLIVLGGLMLFIASHAFGNGSIIWTFVGEIFPNNVRAQGQALGSSTHWVFNAVIAQLFLPLLYLLGPATIFYGFSGLMVFQLLWTIFLMPETKQVSLEEMQKKLGIT